MDFWNRLVLYHQYIYILYTALLLFSRSLKVSYCAIYFNLPKSVPVSSTRAAESMATQSKTVKARLVTGPPPPQSALARHRQLAPSANVRVSPLCLGAMGFGEALKGHMGECSKETAFEVSKFSECFIPILCQSVSCAPEFYSKIEIV